MRCQPKVTARSVVVSGDNAKLALFVPAATKREPVIEIDLAGTRRPLKLTTYVNPGLPPLVRRRGDYDKTLTRLRQGGFAEQASGMHEGWYAAHDAIAPTDDAATPQEALWTVLEGRLKAIVASGTLDPLVS